MRISEIRLQWNYLDLPQADLYAYLSMTARYVLKVALAETIL